jgi:hypothetical protein
VAFGEDDGEIAIPRLSIAVVPLTGIGSSFIRDSFERQFGFFIILVDFTEIFFSVLKMSMSSE